MCGATATPCAAGLVEDPRHAGDPAVGGQVDAQDVDGVVAEQRLGVVRAALLVAHRHRRRRPPSAVGDQRCITGRHEVLDPAELEVGDPGVEAGDVVGGAEHHVGVEADPPVGGGGTGGAQPLDGGVEVRGDRHLEAPPAGVPERDDLGGDGSSGRSDGG